MTSLRDRLPEFGRHWTPPPPPSPEDAAEDARRDAEFAASLRREREQRNHVRDVAAQLLAAGVTARDLRRDAALILRCDECAGRVIGHVTYVGTRPLLWTAERQGRGRVAWLDAAFANHRAWCRVREYQVWGPDLRAELPAVGGKPVEVRVSHDGHVGPLL